MPGNLARVQLASEPGWLIQRRSGRSTNEEAPTGALRAQCDSLLGPCGDGGGGPEGGLGQSDNASLVQANGIAIQSAHKVAVIGVAPQIHSSAGDGPQTGPFSLAVYMRFERAVHVTLHGVDAVPPTVPIAVFVGLAALLWADAYVGWMLHFSVFALPLLGSVGVPNAW